MQYIDDLGLHQTIFTDPSNGDFPTPETSHWKLAYDTLDTLRRNKTPGSIYDTLVRSDEATYFSWVLAAVAPFGRLGQPPHTGKGKAPPPYGTLATREGIKAPHKLCDVCTAAINHREEIMALKRAVLEGSPDVVRERDRFGMAIRHWEAKGGHWRLQVLSALLVEAMEVLPLTANSNGTPDNAGKFHSYVHSSSIHTPIYLHNDMCVFPGMWACSTKSFSHRPHRRKFLARVAGVPRSSRGSGRSRGAVPEANNRRHAACQSAGRQTG